MGKKIIQHPGSSKKSPKENIINKLKLKFPRVERNIDEAKEVSPEEDKFYHPLTGLKRHRLKKTLADVGYIKWGEELINTFLGTCLDHVIYRSLKQVYGHPDFITWEIIKEEVSDEGNINAVSRPTEWGYLIQGKGGSCFEIFNMYRHPNPKIVLWLNAQERPKELPNAIKNSVMEFIKNFYNLIEVVDRDYSIKKEKESVWKITNGKDIRILTNLYYQNFQAGKDVLEISDRLLPELEQFHDELFSMGEWDESLSVYRKTKILYFSAIIYFFMALEGFINLLYRLFLKPEFADQKFERSVWRSDLDLRILHLPVYCKGFTNADISPDSKVYNEWLSIRTFRNDLIHANITNENESIVTVEDTFVFNYNPLFHIKCRDKIKFHTHPFYITKEDVMAIMEKVEIIVSGIIEQMDDEIKPWVESWIQNAIISENIEIFPQER